MSTQLIFIGDILVVVESDLGPPVPSPTDFDEGDSPAGAAEEAVPDGPRIAIHKPFGWGSGHKRKDAPGSGGRSA
jgi:hypothetical protein